MVMRAIFGNKTGGRYFMNTEMDELDLSIVRYKPMALDVLQKMTHFSRRELQIMYRGFKQDCPAGIVDEDTFKNVYQSFFPTGDSSAYAHLVFQSFDREKTGSLTFEQFVQSLSLLIRGSEKEKLAWIFRLYDINGDGRISKTEMIQLCSAVYDLLGRHTEPIYSEMTIREHVERVFQKMDLNKDGVITEDEFMSICLHDSVVLQGLKCLDTVL